MTDEDESTGCITCDKNDPCSTHGTGWIAHSPGGEEMNIRGSSQAECWRKLIHWAEMKRLFYAHRSGLKDRGYTVKRSRL